MVCGPGAGERDQTGARSTLLIYILVPLGLLYLLTATVTPLYHVRYVFLFAPPFMLILAAAILALLQQKTWLALGRVGAHARHQHVGALRILVKSTLSGRRSSHRGGRSGPQLAA